LDSSSVYRGDRAPFSWVKGAEAQMESSNLWRLSADLTRVGVARWSARQAWKEIGGCCDWVYERLGAFQALGRPFARAGIPWIVESNAPMYLEGTSDRRSIASRGWARRAELAVYRDADVIVTVSKALKKILGGFQDVDPDKIIVVPNGVDTRRFDPSLVSPTRFFDGPTIGFVGTLYSWQGVEMLLECVAELRRTEGVAWSVVIAGDGPRYLACRELAVRLGLGADAVRFLGRVPWTQVPSVIAGVDIGYSGQTTFHSGMMYNSPLKIYEYMAMGKPVLASAYEDAKRTIVHASTGLLFVGEDPGSLKNALREAWVARESLEAMGHRARDHAVSACSWEERVRNMIPQIGEVLAGSRRMNRHPAS
jgi:glycosyltransferase involved in cell wall biosynthesis